MVNGKMKEEQEKNDGNRRRSGRKFWIIVIQ
jgi:hypothetical protein